MAALSIGLLVAAAGLRMAGRLNAPSQCGIRGANCVGKNFREFSSRRWFFISHRHDDLAKFFLGLHVIYEVPAFDFTHIGQSLVHCAWISFRGLRLHFSKCFVTVTGIR